MTAPVATPTTRMVTPEGEAVDVPSGEAAQAYLSGKLGFAQDAPVVLQVDGEHKVFTADEAGALLDQSQGFGAHVSNPAAYEHQEEKKTFETLPQEAAAVGLGAARGLSIGLSDPLITSLGGEGARQYLAKQEEYNPGLGTAGEVGGMVLPALLTGGASAGAEGGLEGVSLAAKAARVASAPARGIAALGEGAGGLATRGLEALGASGEGALAQIARPAVSAATEGALYGVGQTVSHAAIENEDLTAEMLLAGAGKGALVGGALGGTLGIASLGFGKAKSTIADFFERESPEATAASEAAIKAGVAPPINDKTADTWIKFVAGGDVEKEELLRTAWKDRARLIHTSEDTLETAQRNVRTDVDGLLDAERHLTEEAQGQLKLSHVEKSIETGNEATTHAFATQRLEEIRGRVRAMLDDAGAYGDRANLKTLDKILESTDGAIGDAAVEGADKFNARAFIELDGLKRRIGKFAKPGQFASNDQATAAVMRELYDGLKGDLENTSLWGKAAEQQTEINKIWTKQLGTKGPFQSRFATDVGRDELDPWLRKFRVDPAKVSGYVNGYGRAANDLNHETLAGHVANTRQLIDTIKGAYDLSPEKLAKVEHAASSVEKFQKTIAHVESEVKTTNALKRLQEEEAGGIGGALGVAVDVAHRPLATISRVAAVEHQVGAVRERMSSGIREFLSKSSTTTKAARAAYDALPSAPRLALEAEDKHRGRPPKVAPLEERFAEAQRRTAIAVSAHAAQRPESPGLGQKTKDVAATIAQNIAARMPKSASIVMQPKFDKPRVSPTEMASFLDYYRGATQPLTILDDLRSGVLRRDTVAAVKENYPLLFADMQKTIGEEVAGLDKKLDYSQRLKIGQLFGVVTDPSLTPDFVRTTQAILSQGGGQKAAHGRKPVNLSGGAQTASNAIERTASP